VRDARWIVRVKQVLEATALSYVSAGHWEPSDCRGLPKEAIGHRVLLPPGIVGERRANGDVLPP